MKLFVTHRLGQNRFDSQELISKPYGEKARARDGIYFFQSDWREGGGPSNSILYTIVQVIISIKK